MTSTDVLIVGAGAAGLMCAMTAAARGRRVAIIDRSNKPGKKILMSGGGRCNFTNTYVDATNYFSQNSHFVKSALARYTQWDFIELVQKHRIAYHEKKLGQLFCDGKSREILDMLLDECRRVNVESQLNIEIRRIEQTDDGYCIDTNAGKIETQSLVIATGGLSIPTLGATGFGYEVAHQFGHKVIPTRAGLVPLTAAEPLKTFCAELSGTSVDCVASCGGQSFRENLLFTHRGLSGPAILQVSSFWRPGESIEINLLPDHDVHEWLRAKQHAQPNAELKTVLGEVFTKKMAALWTDHISPSKPMKQYTPAQLTDLAHHLQGWQVQPAGTEGYRTAEVTIGGVDTREISSKTMESLKSPGLYFIGEVLDVNAHLGGFNFQWAWSSGHAAAQFV